MGIRGLGERGRGSTSELSGPVLGLLREGASERKGVLPRGLGGHG